MIAKSNKPTRDPIGQWIPVNFVTAFAATGNRWGHLTRGGGEFVVNWEIDFTIDVYWKCWLIGCGGGQFGPSNAGTELLALDLHLMVAIPGQNSTQTAINNRENIVNQSYLVLLMINKCLNNNFLCILELMQTEWILMYEMWLSTLHQLLCILQFASDEVQK